MSYESPSWDLSRGWWPEPEGKGYVLIPKEEKEPVTDKVFFEVKPVMLQIEHYELSEIISALHDELGDTLEVVLSYKDGEPHLQLSPTQVHKILESSLEKLLPGLLEL